VAAFDIREPLSNYLTPVRMAYLFADEGFWSGGGTCPVEQDWKACVESFADGKDAGSTVRTCVTTVDIRGIPAMETIPQQS